MTQIIASTRKDLIRPPTEKDITSYRALFKRLRSMIISPMKTIKILYDRADSDYKKAYSEAATCHKGCSHCCSIDVGVTSIEVEYINAVYGIKPTNTDYDVPEKREKQCGFLSDDGTCSIYSARPMACRAFGSFSPAEQCGDPGVLLDMTLLSDGEYGHPMINQTYKHIIAMNNGHAMKHLHQFYDWQLEN